MQWNFPNGGDGARPRASPSWRRATKEPPIRKADAVAARSPPPGKLRLPRRLDAQLLTETQWAQCYSYVTKIASTVNTVSPNKHRIGARKGEHLQS